MSVGAVQLGNEGIGATEDVSGSMSENQQYLRSFLRRRPNPARIHIEFIGGVGVYLRQTGANAPLESPFTAEFRHEHVATADTNGRPMDCPQ